MNDHSSYDKLNKTIKEFNDYLAKIKKELDLNEHDLAIHYDYDLVPLPNEIIDEANECNEQKLYDDNYITQGQLHKANRKEK
jgi:hypothetical protein